jgi:hypothetical protein
MDVYGRYVELVKGGYKPTYTWGVTLYRSWFIGLSENGLHDISGPLFFSDKANWTS